MQERQQTVPVDQRPKLPSHVIKPAKDEKALLLDRKAAEMARAAERAHDSTVTKSDLLSRLSDLVPGSKDWETKWSAYMLMAKAQYSKLTIPDKTLVTKAENRRRDQHNAAKRAPEIDPETGEIVAAA